MNITDRNNAKIQCCNALWNRWTVEVGAQVSYIHRSNKILEVVSLIRKDFGSVLSGCGLLALLFKPMVKHYHDHKS